MTWTVHHDDEGVEIRVGGDLMGVTIYGKEMDAHARLIAAAPDLLAALKNLMAAEGGEPGHTEEQQEVWAQAVAAIAKAESHG
jgi:hypothetical protein